MAAGWERSCEVLVNCGGGNRLRREKADARQLQLDLLA
jgi:hypothetical protein